MNELMVKIRRASTLTRRKWLFAMAWHLKPKIMASGDFSKVKLLYDDAKRNLGVETPIVFGLKQYARYQRDRNELFRAFTCSLLGVVEDADQVRMLVSRTVFSSSMDVHPELAELLFDDVAWCPDPDPGCGGGWYNRPFMPEAREMAKLIVQEEKFEMGPILADCLDDSGHEFEALHLRTFRIHSPACSVVQRVLRS
jgi:hypothetical protein